MVASSSASRGSTVVGVAPTLSARTMKWVQHSLCINAWQDSSWQDLRNLIKQKFVGTSCEWRQQNEKEDKIGAGRRPISVDRIGLRHTAIVIIIIIIIPFSRLKVQSTYLFTDPPMQLKEFILRDYFVKSLLNIKAYTRGTTSNRTHPSNKMWLALLYNLLCRREWPWKRSPSALSQLSSNLMPRRGVLFYCLNWKSLHKNSNEWKKWRHDDDDEYPASALTEPVSYFANWN